MMSPSDTTYFLPCWRCHHFCTDEALLKISVDHTCCLWCQPALLLNGRTTVAQSTVADAAHYSACPAHYSACPAHYSACPAHYSACPAHYSSRTAAQQQPLQHHLRHSVLQH
eukprot:5168-Heterococcus_DN1.PRE.8